MTKQARLVYICFMKNEGLKKAISQVGTQVLLANRLGVSQQRLQWWTKHKLPAEWVLPIEKASGVSRHELRPDLYPREESAA